LEKYFWTEDRRIHLRVCVRVSLREVETESASLGHENVDGGGRDSRCAAFGWSFQRMTEIEFGYLGDGIIDGAENRKQSSKVVE